MKTPCIMKPQLGTLFLLLLAGAVLTGPALVARPQESSSGSSTAAGSASAGVPRLIRFSGAVQDGTGKPLRGEVELTFALYELPEGGVPLWVETQSVQANDQGGYTVLLGANSPDGLPLDLFVSGAARWLGITPALPGVAEQPRALLVGVPYALKAADADTLGGKPASAYVTAEAQGATGTPAASQPGSAVTPQNTSNLSQSLASANSPTSGSSIKGLGTTDFIPIWTSTTTIGNSILFQTGGGNVGIGTTTPTATLQVNGSVAARLSQATGQG